MAIADELIALLGFELTGEDAAKRYEGTLKRLERTAERVGNAIGTGIKIAAAAGAAGFALLTRSVIGVNAEFESYRATLETIEGSADKAQQSLDWITQFAKTTPYDVAQVTEAFIRLKAYGIDPMAEDTLRILGDTASAMGKPMMQAVEALADAQTGEFERLKEFGIRASQAGDEVTFRWTRNGEELTETVKKNATEIRAFLLETMGDSFTGAMDRQSRTWNGMMSNLGDTWSQFQLKVGESGFFERINQRLEGLLATIDRLDAEGKLDQWAAAIGNTLTWFADIFWAVGERIASIVDFLIENFDSLKPILYAVGLALGALLVWAFPVIAAFAALGLIIDDVIAYLQGGESVIGSFIEWCKQLPETLMEAAGAFGTWLSNIDWGKLGNDAGRLLVDALVLVITSYWTGATALGEAVVNAFTNTDWGAVLNAIIAGFQAYIELFYGFWAGVGERIGELIKEWFNIDLVAVGQKMAQDIFTGLQQLGEQISAWFASLFAEPQWLKDAKSFLGMGPDTGPGAVAQEMQSGGQPTPDPNFQTPTLDDDAWDYKMELQRQEWENMLNNAGENLARMAPDQAVDATITDARTDARTFPFETNVTVNQTVTQPSAAPGAAAQATGDAVAGAVTTQRAQIETEPSF